MARFRVHTAANIKVAVFCVVGAMQSGKKFTDVSELLAASIIRAMSHSSL
jgi:hypothetical protein